MNKFNIRKISKRSPRKPIREKTKQTLAAVFGIFFVFFGIYYVGVKLVETLNGTRIVGFIAQTFGKELIQDSYGRTHILLVGVGGEGHEGKDLTDTLIVASLDIKHHSITLLSMPRDLYTESSLGGSRVNRLYEQGQLKWGPEQGLDFLRTTLEKIMDVPLHYVIKVDFEAFEKIVDSIGGIDVFVETAINDPYYPRDGTYEYETFTLAQGNKHLDGKTALKYARSRKTTSDFNRSKRQHQVLLALKKKTMEERLFLRKRFIQQLYTSLQDHLATNMSLREIFSLGDFIMQWDSTKLVTAMLNDEPFLTGGFLYTPLRELYGGAYVLLPAGDTLDSVRQFIHLLFYGPNNTSEIPIAIRNGTGRTGLAGKTKILLQRFGINIFSIDNAENKNIQNTTWYIRDATARPLVDFLQKLIPGDTVLSLPQNYAKDPNMTQAIVILELGKNAVPVIEKLDIFRNVVPLTP